MVKGKPWLEQKRWFDNMRNDRFTEFYEKVCKELQHHMVLDSESEFLNALRKNSLNIIDPLNREVISAWAVHFDKISKPFPMKIRQAVRVDQIVKEQVVDWKKRRDVKPIMGYLYDEFKKRQQQAHIKKRFSRFIERCTRPVLLL